MTGVPQRFMGNRGCSSVVWGQSLTAETTAILSCMCVNLPPHSAPLKVLRLRREPGKLKAFHSKCGAFMVLFQVQPLF